MNKVQIIIPVINLWEEYSEKALSTISVAMMRAKEHGIDSQILFIDNASTDHTQKEAEKRISKLFIYKRNEERWGFQKSVNYGINYAFENGCEYAFVCNNDILLQKDAIWILAERVKGIATCVNISGEITPGYFYDVDPHSKEEVEESPHPDFSAFIISRDCWEKVGEFDEAFAPAYFEDNDYHYRMKLLGIEAVSVPIAIFYHFGSRTQNSAREDNMPMVSHELFEKNRAYMIEKWGSTSAEDIRYKYPFNNIKNSINFTKQQSVNMV